MDAERNDSEIEVRRAWARHGLNSSSLVFSHHWQYQNLPLQSVHFYDMNDIM